VISCGELSQMLFRKGLKKLEVMAAQNTTQGALAYPEVHGKGISGEE